MHGVMNGNKLLNSQARVSWSCDGPVMGISEKDGGEEANNEFHEGS
jgi:hypothetical protein